MAQFCTHCGRELPDGTAFCTECGAQVGGSPRVQQPAAPQSPAWIPPAPVPADNTVSTGAFFGLMLLFALPVIGWLVCIIMCFAPKNKNLKHFARATLIWILIALVLSLLLGAAVSALVSSVASYAEQAAVQAGQTGVTEQTGSLTELMELLEMLEQLQPLPTE